MEPRTEKKVSVKPVATIKEKTPVAVKKCAFDKITDCNSNCKFFATCSRARD